MRKGELLSINCTRGFLRLCFVRCVPTRCNLADGETIPRLASSVSSALEWSLCQHGTSGSARSASASCCRPVAQGSHDAWTFCFDHHCGFPMGSASGYLDLRLSIQSTKSSTYSAFLSDR